MKGDYRITKSSDAEKVRQIYHEREVSRQALYEDFDRGINAWKYYFSRSGDQWPERKLAILKEQERYPYQFNILTPKVNTMAGAMITDMPDPDWSPIEGTKTTATEGIKTSFYSDKEITNWEFALIELVKAGLVHSGWLQMVETKKYHPLGNIGLEFVPHNFVPSAYWKTNNDRDLREGWKSVYMTPDGIAFKFKKSERVAQAMYEYKKHAQSIPKNAPELREKFEGQVGDEFEVIENFWTEILNKERLIGKRMGQMQWIPFPITKDEAEIEKFAEINNIDWDTVDMYPYDDIISHRTAICPSLDPTLILFDGKSRVQCKGLPFFHFTTQRHNGRNKGLAETIIDIQSTLNERISLETELISKANGGSNLVNDALFSDENQKKRFKKNMNVPGHTEFVDLDSVNKVREEIGPNQYPSQILSQIELMFKTLLPIVSGVSDAWSAESASEDSGVLFERKVQMNKIATLVYDKQLKQLVNNVGEAYFYQWKITYGDSERKMRDRKGREIILNERLDMNGTIRNSVHDVPRVSVVVTERLSSPTRQVRDRNMANEMLRNINPEANPLLYQNFMKIFIRSLDRSDEEKMQFEADMELERAAAQTALVGRIAQATAGTSAAALQDQQANMQMQQLQGQEVQEQITTPEQQVAQVPREQEQ